MSHSGTNQGPDFKDQFRESSAFKGAAHRTDDSSSRASSNLPFKTQVQTNGPGGPANNGTPLVQAELVDSTITGTQQSSTNTSGNDGEFVLKVSKRKVFWSMGLLLVLAGAAIGGYCASGKCSRSDDSTLTDSTQSSAGLGTPSLRPVTTPATSPVSVPVSNPVSNPVSAPMSNTVASPASAPVPAPVTPTATSCASNSDCPLGVCARETLTSLGTVCCPSGDSDYLSRPISAYVCTGQTTGAACQSDSICDSKTCYQGTCLSAPQAGGAGCDSNADCIGTCVEGTCTEGAFATVGATCDDGDDCATGDCAHGTVSTGLICCPTYDSVYLSSPISKYVCTGQLVGAMCGASNGICQSGVCFQGVCLDGQQDNGAPCDNNADCKGACINGSCADGFQPAGATCDDDGDCANGECAHETASMNDRVCCPSGESTYLSSPISRSVCTQQSVGAACGSSDRICESGVCFQGLCQSGQFANGEACGSNADCQGTCVEGICVDGFIGPDEICDDSNDCANRECALPTVNSGSKVCCRSGDSIYLSSPISENVCTGQDTDALCGVSNQLCASGVCVAGTCRSSQQAAGALCDSNSDCVTTCVNGACTETTLVALGDVCDDDADCPLNECAASTAVATDKVCCVTGDAAYLSSPIAKDVCTNQEAGAACGNSNRVCASGICNGGICA